MTHVKTNQKTFGKGTQRLIKKLIPSARMFKRIGRDFIIKDADGNTVATWHHQIMENGLIIIR